MRFVARVLVRPKAEVRDPQGEAVLAALRSLGHDVAEVRTGKEIVVTFEARDETAAREAADRMGDQLLANPVIESYSVEVEREAATAR
jgi:phosphoribosylformylglycinamidine synthase